MDSGAFTTIAKHGDYPHPVGEYAAQIRRWATNGSGRLLAAVSQDYMCEAHMLHGRTIADNQRLTIERYDALLTENTGVYIMPVLQGYSPESYVSHIQQYAWRLPIGAWVGVGSVCKRNGKVEAVEAVLCAVKQERPDLRIHGFGLKTTALKSWLVATLLESSDSMAWSFGARVLGRNQNSWIEAKKWELRINAGLRQLGVNQ